MAGERAEMDPAFAAANMRADLVLRLLPLRKELGLTQDDVAIRMGIARPQVAAMETRPHKVSLDRIAAYALALGARLELVLPKRRKRTRAAERQSWASALEPQVDVQPVLLDGTDDSYLTHRDLRECVQKQLHHSLHAAPALVDRL